MSELESALRRGSSALLSMQNPDGSFPLYQRTPDQPWRPCHPLFATTSVVLAAGSLMPAPALQRAADFIRGCRRSDRTGEFDPTYKIPADSDDTACALTVLARHGGGLVGPADVALLRSFWRPDGGPFQTWHQADAVWSRRDRDDAVVNCNILLALRGLGAPATGAETSSVTRLTRASEAGCRYYCSPTTIAYAARRGGLPHASLPARITAKPTSGLLPTAQWLSLVGQWDEDAVAPVLAAQSPDGSWHAEAWFTAAGKPPPGWGSAATSTALCVEALHTARAARGN